MSRIETIGDCTLYLGDCREILPALQQRADAVVADPPYGITQNKWDSIVPFAEMWPLLWGASKEEAAIVLTAAQPFTATLICSQIMKFRYSWVWQKSRPTGHLNAKKQPLREHEDLCVFYRSQPTYNPQFTLGEPNHVGSKPRTKSSSTNYGQQYEIVEEATDRKYPKTVLQFDALSPTHVEHPTQKPVDLIAYMIRTYSDHGMTILDPFMGSGTAGVAAAELGRKFIGIEIEPKYFDIACRRIAAAVSRPAILSPLPPWLRDWAARQGSEPYHGSEAWRLEGCPARL